MRLIYCILLVLAVQGLLAQNELADTVKIPIVPIQSGVKKLSNATTIDSAIAQDPINQNLGELIGKQSPIFIKSYGIGSLSTVSMRGSGASHTNILWNGIVLNSSMNGQVDLSLFPSFFLDETSINYGTSSLEGAAGGLGGAIQMNSNPKLSKNKLRFNQQLGSFGLSNTQVGADIKFKKWVSKTKLFYKEAQNDFIYTDIGSEGFPEKELQNAGLKQYGIKQDVFWNRSEKNKYAFQFWYHNSERNLPSIYTVNNVLEKQMDESLRALFSSKFYFQRSTLEIVTSALKDKIDYQNLAADINSVSNTFDSKSYILYEREIFNNWQLKAKTNVDVSRAEQDAYDEILNQERGSTYIEIVKPIRKKIFVKLSGRNEIILGEENYLLPAIEVSYESDNKNWMFLSKYGQNVKYPSLNDLYWIPGGNPELVAEESKSVELGVKFQRYLEFFKLDFDAQLNVYQSEIENYILWRPTAFGYWQAQNLKNVDSKGLEFRTQVKSKEAKLEKLIAFNYTYVKSVNTNSEHEFDNSKDKQLIYVPEHQYNLFLKLTCKSYFLNYNLQFVGARYTTTDNVDFLPYYNLSDFSLGKTLKMKEHNFEVSISVLNAFNEEYQAIQWRPMPQRNYLFNLKYQIHAK